MRTPSLSALFALAGIVLVDAKLSLKTPKYSVLSDAGSVLSADPLDLSSSSLPTVNVGKSDTLKLSFTVVDDETGEDAAGVQPHQAFLRFSSSTGEEGIQPVKVSSSGKAKFELNARRPPPGLPPTSTDSVLTVSLILGSYTHTSSVLPLLKLTVPPSYPVAPHPEEVHYHPKPLLIHTFRDEQRMPNQAISVVFVGIALSPWIVLLGLLSRLPIHLSPSSSTAPFIASLAVFEGLIIYYWIDLKIGQVLSYGAVLALITAAAGKRALETL